MKDESYTVSKKKTTTRKGQKQARKYSGDVESCQVCSYDYCPFGTERMGPCHPEQVKRIVTKWRGDKS